MLYDLHVQGTSTLAFLVGTWAMARGVALTPRARLAANCLAGVAFLQVHGYNIQHLVRCVP